MTPRTRSTPAVPGADSPVVPVPPPATPARPAAHDDDPPAAENPPPTPAPSPERTAPPGNAVAPTETPRREGGTFANMLANVNGTAGRPGAGGGTDMNVPLAALVGGGQRKDPEADWVPVASRLRQRTLLALRAAMRMEVFRHPNGKAMTLQEVYDLALDQILPAELTDRAHQNEYGETRPPLP